ncbi:MAG: hypothetical protein E6G45_08645 [Actinobacteria bacterium]|nr:MAG: hypothetical protein E6G45_08645 [Actinomycetota bacterium]
MTGPPEFRDLVGDDLPAEERARLERVHELLMEAGPPPELPPSLAKAPDRATQSPSWLPRRRLGTALALAAAIALIAFLGGYLAGYSHNSFHSSRQVAMHGTSAARLASGLIKLGKPDRGGNWPMIVTVRGLPGVMPRGYYELYLTRNGKRILRCGSFNPKTGSTSVRFSVPYAIRSSDGWVVTRKDTGERGPETVVLKT